MPILSGHYWFVTAYLLLYLAIPLLNKLFYVLDKQTLARYLLLFLVLWFVIPPLGPKIKIAGSSFDNFICLYYIGAFIKRYGLNFLEKNFNALLLIFISEGIICFYQITFIVIHFLNRSWFMHLSGSNSIFTTITSVSLFMILKNQKINYNPIINFFASSAFAVYLITENTFVKQIIWSKFFHCNYSSNLLYVIFNMILALFVSYFVCIIIDKIRIKLFANHILIFIENQYNKIYNYISKFI